MFGHLTKELFKDSEKCLDPQLWHACAGGMVKLPPANSKVYYFPQGHAEHCVTDVEFPSGSTRIPAFVLCHVASVKFLADKETDEVFAKIRLVPARANESDYYDVDDELVLSGNGSDVPEKPSSFAKTLTQSDANNSGGFSVPRYCAETILPPLDYLADPPLQTILAKDVHGEIWKLRHIYRGTPRRHLLTTGWSTFVNQKKLVAGDSIVFLRTENGELCIGIRRTKRGLGVGADSIFRWNPPPNGSNGSAYGGFSTSLREEESKLMRSNSNGVSNAGGFANVRRRGRVKAESVVEAAMFVATWQTFEVVYYPRPSIPEFCVKAGSVRAAMRLQWCSGMRCKMPFETEDSSRISWFMGTISSVQVADPLRWPNSPWRLLQVTWDEPDLLQNVRAVSPWLVELVSSIPSVHLTPFLPPRKKPRIPQHPESPLDIQFPTPVFFPGNHPFGPSSNSAGIQGTRHLLFGNISVPNLHVSKLQSRLLQANFHRLEHTNPTSTISTDLFITSPNTQNDISCLLTVGRSGESLKKPSDEKTPLFVLFGKPILTEEQISLCNSGNSFPDGNHEKITSRTDGFLSSVHQPSCEGLPSFRDYKVTELELETGHCKVFMESENVGRTLDLSVLASYEELYDRLAAMFGVEKFEMTSNVLYRNGFGEIKHTGDEPFSDFMKTTRRLRVLLDSASDNLRARRPFGSNFP